MLWLYVQAPFAAFRTFTAGSFRPTAPAMTPSAAYGLLLNLAGIEMRQDDGKSAMTLIANNLPQAEIALGSLAAMEQHSLFQQAHGYRVGDSVKIDDPENPGKKITIGEEGFRRTRGNKYQITPVRRAFLSNLRVCIGLRGDEALEEQVREGLAGRGPARYGLPFLGDNNFLPDRIELLEAPRPARWWLRIKGDEAPADPVLEVARLTVTIDRQDLSRTSAPLFRPLAEATDEVPPEAWVAVGY